MLLTSPINENNLIWLVVLMIVRKMIANTHSKMSVCKFTNFMAAHISNSSEDSQSFNRSYTIEYGVYKFILVFHCNCVPIFCHFWDTQHHKNEIWVSSNSRSQKMAPLDRSHRMMSMMSSYWQSAVIMDIWYRLRDKARYWSKIEFFSYRYSPIFVAH